MKELYSRHQQDFLTTMTIETLIENFELLGDWEDRYAYVMELGQTLDAMAEEDKTEENRVKGCQATVWLKSQTDDQTPPSLSFVADSNSQIVKGLVYILHLMFSGKPISEIIAYDEKAIFSKLGLDRHLSPTRSTGLNAMVKQIKAQAHSAG